MKKVFRILSIIGSIIAILTAVRTAVFIILQLKDKYDEKRKEVQDETC